jgi:hypothetical protein
MKQALPFSRFVRLAALAAAGVTLAACASHGRQSVEAAGLAGAASNKPGIELTWVEKYLTFSQSPSGELTQTDAIFLAEVIYTDTNGLKDTVAKLNRVGEAAPARPLAIYRQDDLRAFTNGYFYTRKSQSYDDLQTLEADHPSSAAYRWTIEGAHGPITLAPIRIGGPEGATQIPKLTGVTLSQNGVALKGTDKIDPNLDLQITWAPFTIGQPLPGSKWSDLNFLLLDNCRGENIYTGGAPGTDEEYLDYRATQDVVPAGTLEPGMSYVVFLSQVNYVDHNFSHGVEQLSANSFAVELPMETSGKRRTESVCPAVPKMSDYRFSRKSARGQGMESWPTLQENAQRKD